MWLAAPAADRGHPDTFPRSSAGKGTRKETRNKMDHKSARFVYAPLVPASSHSLYTIMIAVQTNPQLPLSRPAPLKPSKSSMNLTGEEYTRHFTLAGRQSLRARIERLLPPVDVKITCFCLVWYAVSAVSSNITKEILRRFPHPTSLTEFQFLISSMFCVLTIWLVNNNRSWIEFTPTGALPSREQFHKARTTWNLIRPGEKVIRTTLPMGIFQFVGHITSHQATSLIPVSLVHSVKALSPLTTVLAYRLWFEIKYAHVTYLTLIPLMSGVILTCFGNNTNMKSIKGFYKGIAYAFISMIIFVSQNIFAKKILTWSDSTLPIEEKRQKEEKIDKITILLYCSLFGFAFTLPVYLISEFSNEQLTLWDLNTSVVFLLLLHGVSHFMQAMLAFHLIGLVTPVNYSIANILKRIVVIAMALVWERESVNSVQGLGLVFTMGGLYAYDRWGMKN